MWKCKHCKKEFENLEKSEKANHARWCEENPKRNSWNKSQGTINQYGEIKKYTVECFCCKNQFDVQEREKLYPQKDVYYCSRSCANSIGGKAKAEKHHHDGVANYTTVCWRHHEKSCIVCGEHKIVSVHHIDENHSNNDPKNLVPLCPTHHQYVHSRYRNEVQPIIDKYVKEKWAVGIVGNTVALQASVIGSNPIRSTI